MCSKVHPRVDCHGSCEDKSTCKKKRTVSCKNGSTCAWKFCEFLHRKDQQETELAKIKLFVKIVEEQN